MPDSKAKVRDAAIAAAAKKPGDVLPNGAVILAHGPFKLVDRTEAAEAVVLAFQPDAYQKFVTWKHAVGIERMSDGSYGPIDYTFSGAYHMDIESAVKSYKRRV
jgi:hypothetical protein